MEANAIVGSWVTSGGSSQVSIRRQGDVYVGHISALKRPRYRHGDKGGAEGSPRVDSHNPDPGLQQRPLLGLPLLNGFHFDGEQWRDGTIYDPNNGKTYKAQISLGPDGRLYLRGYVGVTLLGRTTVWEPLAYYRKRELAFLGVECRSPAATPDRAAPVTEAGPR
jgi:uncharacterized protein (DUF2147 family)